jgi:hypothetical protein
MFPATHPRLRTTALDLPSLLFPSGFSTKILYAFLISTMYATCSTHHILLDLISPIISGEKYKP